MSLSGYGRPSSHHLALQNLTTGGGSMPILQPPSLFDPLPPYRGGRRVGRAGRDGRRGGRGGAGVGGGRGRPAGGGVSAVGTVRGFENAISTEVAGSQRRTPLTMLGGV